jgi:diguanylate cyclase (GGDEF)-like protein/PAS domain S-box-containing protein
VIALAREDIRLCSAGGPGTTLTVEGRTTGAMSVTVVHELQSDATFRLVAESTMDVILLARPEAALWISPRVQDTMGYRPEDLVGAPPILLVHPDDVADVLLTRGPLATGQPAHARCRLRHADGTWHWWESRARGLPDADGGFSGLSVSTWRCIDDSVELLERAERSERWFRLLAENSSDVVAVLHHGGLVEWVSRPFGVKQEWAPERLTGRVPWELIHPDDAAAAAAALAQIERDGRLPEPVLLRFVIGRHGFRWVLADGQVVDGDLANGMVLSFRDVDVEIRARQQLAESERQFRLLAENATDVVYSVDARARVTWISPSVQELLGWRPEQLIGDTLFRFMHPDDLAAATPKRAAIIASGGSSGDGRIRFATADGGWRWMSITGRALRDEAGAIVGGIESLRDVDHEVRAGEALAESERRFRLAMHGSPEGMAMVGLDRGFMSVNPALCDLVARPEDWFASHVVDDVLHPDDIAADHEVRTRLLAGDYEDRTQERRLMAADGTVLWALHSIGLLRDNDDHPLFFVSHFQDITARKSAESHLEYAATHDPLTGLANRANLVDEISRALGASRRSGRPTALVMLDLDHFKFVNDSLGHATGDELLREAACRLRSIVREGDLVARQGGDEFVVVMRDLDDPAEAVRVAQRVVDVFRSPVHVEQAELFATASVGITISRDGTDADALLAEADAAMYVAKAEGRDRLSLYNDELRAAVTERLRIENGLRHALERDELEVWYQPEIDLVEGRISAVEALVRWNHPGGEVFTAGRFIEVAEDSGLIVELGAMVMRRGCAQAALWNQAHPRDPVIMRVNLSTRQLADADLLATIDDAVATTGVSTAHLCFEITETAILRDIPVVDANLHGIHDRGIALAVDDFGTGYASLTYLREFPISVLKLDRSFVAGIATNSFDRRLVAGVIALAHGLDIMITAEGVEHEEQVDVLRSLGCRHAQGFLFSKAVPAGELERLLRA